MKKLLALFLALMMLFSVATTLVGCEEKGSKKSVSKQQEEENEEATEDETTKGEESPTESEEPEPTEEDIQPTEPVATEPEATLENAPLLYKVTDGDGNVIWLFGSIHVGRDDYYPLPEYVLDAYEGSDALAVELDAVAFENDMTAQT